jgi:hypothetical protein
MLRLSGESNSGPSALQANTLCKEPFGWRIELPFGISACAATAPPPSRDGVSWLNVIRLRVAYAWRSDRMHVTVRELCITSGSPLCIGLTRAIYILCIEHLRMLRLSRESNPGPPALQANTLCKEPFERHIELPFGISACAATV